jgi:hypothetical protein
MVKIFGLILLIGYLLAQLAFGLFQSSNYAIVKKSELEPKIVEVCTDREAMQWWTGSSDLNVQRDLLCFNVVNPKCKSNKVKK